MCAVVNKATVVTGKNNEECVVLVKQQPMDKMAKLEVCLRTSF